MSDNCDLESRWPRDEDRLFIESQWAYDGHIITDPGERFYRMPMGSHRAGDILINQAINDAVDRRNILYAALFCYRQSIELFLKKFINAFGKEKTYSPKHPHDLRRLWERFMCIVNERDVAGAQGLEIAQKLVIEMHEADQRSDGFLFPTDRKELPFLFGDRGIDLENVREVMSGLANFFECAYLALCHQEDTANNL